MPVSGSNGYRSGIVTLPNRVRIREMDSRQWMYPTIARTGDATRGGNLNIPEFNDTQTILFKEGVSNLLLGSLLESGSTRSLLPYAGNNNPNGGITGTGNVISGISDNFYMTDYKELTNRNHEEESDPENLGFFDDSRVNLSDSVFYMTGTAENVYPGFNSRLHDKTQIVIDMSSNSTTYIGNTSRSTGSLGIYTADTTDARQPYMGYYNHVLKRWETLGKGWGLNQSQTGGRSIEENFYDIINTACIGFDGPLGKIATGSFQTATDYRLYNDDLLSSVMRPISTFGFPFDGRYHATGSQVIEMSNYINAPFVVEKVVFNFDALIETGDAPSGSPENQNNGYRLGAAYTSSGLHHVSINANLELRNYNFFLLRQFKNNFEKSWDVITGSGDPINTSGVNYGVNVVTSSIPGYYRLVSGSDDFTLVEDERELITYGQLIDYFADESNSLTYGSGFTKSDFENSPLVNGRDAIFERSSDTYTESNGTEFTGSFSVPCKVRHTAGVLPANRMRIRGGIGGGTQISTWLQNRYSSRGRDVLDKSRRALVNGHGSVNKGQKERLQPFASVTEPFEIEPSDSSTLDDHSPYILFPEDKIIIGFQYPPAENLSLAGGVGQMPDLTRDARLNRFGFNGPGKVTLYGSLVSNNKEFHDTLNQTLTSEAVHEAIHYDNPVLDQYLIATRNEYTGSYVDMHSTGSVGSAARSLIGSGENVLSGSLQRFINIKNPRLRYYDTVMPSIEDIYTADGFSLTSPKPFIGYDDPNVKFGRDNSRSGAGSNDFEHTFLRYTFPFEARYSNARRVIEEKVWIQRADAYFGSIGASPTNYSFLGRDVVPASVGDIGPGKTLNDAIANSIFQTFTFGKGPRGFHLINAMSPNIRLERPTGFKYGIKSVDPHFSKNIFRYDKYGQYADMLEQGKESRFFLGQGAITQGALDIKFVADDDENDQFIILDEDEITSNTFESSNLSIYATSSLPFFDDTVTRNRSYDNIQFSNKVVDVVGFEV